MYIQYSNIAILAALPTIWALPSPHQEHTGVYVKGVFHHDGRDFALFSRDAAVTPEAAYDNYIANLGRDQQETIEKRGYDPEWNPNYHWFNCTAEGTFVGGCNNNKEYAPTEYLAAVGYETARQNIDAMLWEAFHNDRGYDDARSICRVEADHNFCVSWERGVKGQMRVDQHAAILDLVMSCAGPDQFYSSQVRTAIDDDPKDGMSAEYLMVCFSNRAKGCTRADWFCSDLFNKPSDFNRGMRTKHTKPDPINTGGWKYPWAQGPCDKNC